MSNLDKMNFVQTDLSMPLYMLTRTRLKEDKPFNRNQQVLLQQFLKARKSYARKCKPQAKDTNNTLRCKYLTGRQPSIRKVCPQPRQLAISRDLDKKEPWHIPPIYDVFKVPFDSLKGKGGAHWPVERKKHKKKNLKDYRFRYYDVLNRGIDKMCCKEKCKFATDARKRRPTNRSMVSNTQTCYRNPDEPGPADFYPRLHELSYNVSIKKKPPRPNPHNFLRNSCVPETANSIHRKNISFEPGPGRFENRYDVICPCSAKLIYTPGLEMYIDVQKRLRFRQLPYDRIKARLHCSPDWQHVVGKGFRRLFGKPRPPAQPITQTITDPKQQEKAKQRKMFVDSQYLNMITNPERKYEPPSLRAEPIRVRETKVVFNCTAKHTLRNKQLVVSKKIVFGSGVPRWKEYKRPLPLTETQLKALKASLPVERQLRDHEVMRVTKGHIGSKLHQTPPHMMPTYKPALRKPTFKFKPIAEPHLLVTEKDVRPVSFAGVYKPVPFYEDPVNILAFLKDNRRSSKIKEAMLKASESLGFD